MDLVTYIMPLKIYNTLKHEKEPFAPMEAGKVKMYVCGVTVYDSCHIGHARAAVVFDVIYRFLKASGYEVTYVRNFTDIDDKIIKRVQELGMDYRELTAKYIQEYLDEMKLLNVLEPTHQPKATEHIEDMVRLIQSLVDKKLAYVAGGDVYFEVSKLPSYGRLSRRTLEEMRAGARINPDEKKTHPEDFALWKGAKPGEPSWPTPWGKGRPGWHIECSAMSMKHLGQTLDIHGGGSDLIFPHHENEIAQSEGSTGKPFAHYWVHNEMIMIEQTKMSKSLGNVFILKELLKEYPARAVRYFLITTHYRTPMDFSIEGLNEARQALDRIETTIARVQDEMKGFSPAGSPKETVMTEEWISQFREAMEDDFNTPKALGVLFKLLAQLNQDLDRKANENRIHEEFSIILKMLDFLGIQTDTRRFHKIREDIPLDEVKVKEFLRASVWTDEDLEYLVKARENARRKKLWALADEIRSVLRKRGVEIQDERDGAKFIRPVSGR
jgi:cysteinyl-tRNA synthetase